MTGKDALFFRMSDSLLRYLKLIDFMDFDFCWGRTLEIRISHTVTLTAVAASVLLVLGA